MKQRIFVLGASWNVGRELVKQIVRKDGSDNHVNPSVIVGMANSSDYIFSAEWINSDFLESVIISEDAARKVLKEEWNPVWEMAHLLKVVKDSWMDWEVVFADVTAWKKELLNFHKMLLKESSNYLVTANKNPISLYSMEDFMELTACTWRYDTNTTVMWWWGILNFVYERTDKIKDDIKSISGVLSGTLAYIMSELKQWEETFSQIVKKAKQNGYTEPNPWDDLNGLDVARKLVILARYSGYYVHIDDVEVSPLIPEKYSQFEWDEFLEKIQNEDEYFEKLNSKAREQNKVLAYVWEIKYSGDKISLKVWLQEVDAHSDIWMLESTSNIALVETKILALPLPHVIKSRWAGLWVTAASVRVWIAKMLPHNVKTR